MFGVVIQKFGHEVVVFRTAITIREDFAFVLDDLVERTDATETGVRGETTVVKVEKIMELIPGYIDGGEVLSGGAILVDCWHVLRHEGNVNNDTTKVVEIVRFATNR